MSAEDKLEQLCRRHGLPPSEARDLLPLVRRALGSPGTIGRCLLAVAEAALAARTGSAGPGNGDRERERERLEERLLVALAGILHDWEPE